MKILIVDDKEESNYLLESLLKGNGFDVELATNGAQAVEKLQTGEVRLIISDILMPVMDGFQLCQKIKSNETLCHIPIIIYTATYTGLKDEEFAMKIGANRFIRKPCEPNEFIEVVRNVMKSAATKGVVAVKTAEQEEGEILKFYNERLVRKLEQKMLEVESEVQARKEAEDTLRITNTRLQLAISSSNIGLWDWNLKTNDVWFSPEWKRQIGYKDHELPNRYEVWENHLHPEDCPGVLAELNGYLDGHIPIYNVDFRFRHKNGSYRWITSRGEIMPESCGKPRRLTGCHVDITPYKEAIQAIDAEKTKFQILVDGSPLGISLVNNDNQFKYLNPRFVEIFGYDLKDVPSLQKWIENACPDPQYRQKLFFLWQQAKRENDPEIFRASPMNMRCKNGIDKQIQIRITFMANGNQVITYEDVSEQIRLEEKLQQAQKMESIATLAGGIAHDFNNILSAVIGYSELALNDLPSGSITSNYITEVLTAGCRAKDLTGHILAFSRQTIGKQIPMAPHVIVKEVLNLLKATLPSTIEVRQNVVPAGTVIADPTKIHQIIMNLCTNAYHVMQEKGGVLEVSVRDVTLQEDLKDTLPDLAPGHYVRLSVSDTGVGIPSESISRIFDPYYTTKAEGEGTGLGLAVTHGIVKSYQGAIYVYSELGKGSVFHVYLPRIELSEDAEREVFQTPLPTGIERILLVDDEVELVNLGKKMLETLGYNVVIRSNAIETLELFRNKPEMFDLVITDMTMPGMTGAELSIELMRIRPNIPIILCTGFSHSMSEKKAKAIGIRELVMKPLMRMDLAVIIRKVLDHD